MSQSPRASRTNFLACCPPSDEKRQAPSLSTRLGFPVKVSARGLMSWSMMTVVGEVVLRWLISIVRTARDVEVPGGSAACSAAVAAAGVLAIVFFAQNALERVESVMMVGEVVLLVVLSSVCVACIVVTSFGCSAVCEAAAETAAFVDVFAFDEFFDDFGADETVRKLSFVRFCCPFD